MTLGLNSLGGGERSGGNQLSSLQSCFQSSTRLPRNCSSRRGFQVSAFGNSSIPGVRLAAQVEERLLVLTLLELPLSIATRPTDYEKTQGT